MIKIHPSTLPLFRVHVLGEVKVTLYTPDSAQATKEKKRGSKREIKRIGLFIFIPTTRTSCSAEFDVSLKTPKCVPFNLLI
jgi:hypothetical protein